MGIFNQKASTGGDDFEVPPAGSHPAVLVGMFDCGTQDDNYPGKAPSKARKLLLVWELTAEKKADGKSNFIIGRQYTLSLNKKAALRLLIEKWRGKDMAEGEEFDLGKLLGKPCLLNVVHTSSGDKSYAKVDGASAAPKGLTVPLAQTKPTAWEIGSGPLPQFDWIPYCFGKTFKDIVAASEEMKAKVSNGTAPHPMAQHEPEAAEAF